jgi:predicted nucleic acid-binding Zn ribbon protein
MSETAVSGRFAHRSDGGAGGRGTVTGVSDPVPIARSLDSIMKSLRGTDRIQIGGVFGRWDDAVGPAVAAHVRPVRLDQGVLTVEADEPAWATQVKFLSSTITSRLAEVAGVHVERIDVRVAGSSRR